MVFHLCRKKALELSASLEKALEEGKECDLVEAWRKVRELTIRELERTYERLGIKFDEYHGEAMYREVAQSHSGQRRRLSLRP